MRAASLHRSRGTAKISLIVGFQDSASSPGEGYFILRNSWSTSWAYQSPYGAGYGTIPYQYITNDAWEAFSAVVPVPTGDSLTEPQDDTATTRSSVVIEVGRDVKITIETG